MCRIDGLAAILAVKVRNGTLIAATETLAVVLNQFGWDTRVAVLVAVIGVWPTMIVHIAVRAYYPVLKTTPRDLAEDPPAPRPTGPSSVPPINW